MVILKENTRSLCNICKEEIGAKVYVENRQIIMEKQCPLHGIFYSAVEKDLDCYKTLAHFRKEKGSNFFDILTIPITYKCNSDCSFCYLPNRAKEDINIKKLHQIIANFKGKVIALSGGEPTLRSDLSQIIQFIKKIGKFSVLLTNGLKLEDINYVRMLKSSGLSQVFFSFDGFDNKVYRLIKNSENILEKKLKALENLHKERLATIISTTIYEGTNEEEIRKIFKFAIAGSHIAQVRIRNCAKVGNFKEDIHSYFISEMLDLFSKAINITRKDLFKNFLCKHSYNTPHRVDLMIYFYKRDKDIFILPNLSRILNKINFIMIKLLKYVRIFEYLDRFVWTFKKRRGIFNRIYVRICSWPNIENIDLDEVDRGIAHLYGERILNFCHAVVLNEEL
jgi:MoaA/NifB/PqqE/SkfB family radical SAM enzyme